MKVTTAVLTAAAALMMTAGASVAAPKHYSHGHHYNSGKHLSHRSGINAYERVAIARSAANLAALKRRAWTDGRLTFRERVMIRNAERRHAALVARARRT